MFTFGSLGRYSCLCFCLISRRSRCSCGSHGAPLVTSMHTRPPCLPFTAILAFPFSVCVCIFPTGVGIPLHVCVLIASTGVIWYLTFFYFVRFIILFKTQCPKYIVSACRLLCTPKLPRLPFTAYLPLPCYVDVCVILDIGGAQVHV